MGILKRFEVHALRILRDSGPAEPYQLYERLFPCGTFTRRKDYGSSKGGPSRTECAVNWHLGKLGPLATRQAYIGGDGMWRITEEGLEALHLHEKRIEQDGH